MMNQIQIKEKTITVKWDAGDDELFVDIYRYGGKLKCEKCKGTTTYVADEQGVYRFVAYRERDGKKYLFSHQIVELFEDDTKKKYDKFRLEKVSDIRHSLDYYPYMKPFQDIAICINVEKLDITKDNDLKNYFAIKYDEKISFISSEEPAEIEDGFALMSGYMFCNGKLILGNNDIKDADCSKTDFEGCYSRVVISKNKIKLDSDYLGTHAFYLFENGNTKIISNHYHMLMKLLCIMEDVHLSIRSNYISDIMAGFCGVNEYPFDNFTLFSEIQTISIYDRLDIIDGLIEKRRSKLCEDLAMKKPVLSEQVYQKEVQKVAQSIVNTIQIIAKDERIESVSVDLTGGGG